MRARPRRERRGGRLARRWRRAIGLDDEAITDSRTANAVRAHSPPGLRPGVTGFAVVVHHHIHELAKEFRGNLQAAAPAIIHGGRVHDIRTRTATGMRPGSKRPGGHRPSVPLPGTRALCERLACFPCPPTAGRGGEYPFTACGTTSRKNRRRNANEIGLSSQKYPFRQALAWRAGQECPGTTFRCIRRTRHVVPISAWPRQETGTSLR